MTERGIPASISIPAHRRGPADVMASDPVGRAIEHGLRFLLGSQAAAGHWTDWSLPPGESRMWTTAYAGYRLSAVPQPWRESLHGALRLAAAWLARSECRGGGWGYNDDVGPDADSTSLGILFLSSQGVRVPARSYDRLRSFQQQDGGFSTYTHEQSFGAWSDSHPDVTALAIPALLTRYHATDRCIARATQYEIAQATPEGLWPSYWWSTPLYATEANLRSSGRTEHGLRAARVRDALLRTRPDNMFETALLVLCLLHSGCGVDQPAVAGWIDRLLERHLPDGSWPSAPILRVPPRDWYLAGGDADSAPIFADQRRIFTSATAVAALATAWERDERMNSSGRRG